MGTTVAQGGTCNFGQCPDGSSPGICGCGRTDEDTIDTDGDTVPDCIDQCPGFDDRMLTHEHTFEPAACVVHMPGVSRWGLATLVLLLMMGGTIAVLHRLG